MALIVSSESFLVVMLHLEAKGGTTVEDSCHIQTRICVICHLTPFSGLNSFFRNS